MSILQQDDGRLIPSLLLWDVVAVCVVSALCGVHPIFFIHNREGGGVASASMRKSCLYIYIYIHICIAQSVQCIYLDGMSCNMLFCHKGSDLRTTDDKRQTDKRCLYVWGLHPCCQQTAKTRPRRQHQGNQLPGPRSLSRQSHQEHALQPYASLRLHLVHKLCCCFSSSSWQTLTRACLFVAAFNNRIQSRSNMHHNTDWDCHTTSSTTSCRPVEESSLSRVSLQCLLMYPSFHCQTLNSAGPSDSVACAVSSSVPW